MPTDADTCMAFHCHEQKCPSQAGADMGGAPRGRSSTCEQRDTGPTLTQDSSPAVAGNKQRQRFPPDNSDQCVHPEVPSGTLNRCASMSTWGTPKPTLTNNKQAIQKTWNWATPLRHGSHPAIGSPPRFRDPGMAGALQPHVSSQLRDPPHLHLQERPGPWARGTHVTTAVWGGGGGE